MTNLITTDLAPAPSRARPTLFSTEMDAFLGKLPAWTTEANALAEEANTNAGTAAAAAITASADAITASAAAISAVNAPGTFATSTTSLTIGTGSKSLTIQTGKAFSVGQFVTIAYTTAPSNYMLGQITAYTSGTGALVVNVTVVGGSGTQAAWTIALAVSLLTAASTVEMEAGTETSLRTMSPLTVSQAIKAQRDRKSVV